MGDLQDVLRAAWELLSIEQRAELMASEAVEATLEMGGYSFEDDEEGDQ